MEETTERGDFKEDEDEASESFDEEQDEEDVKEEESSEEAHILEGSEDDDDEEDDEKDDNDDDDDNEEDIKDTTVDDSGKDKDKTTDRQLKRLRTETKDDKVSTPFDKTMVAMVTDHIPEVPSGDEPPSKKIKVSKAELYKPPTNEELNQLKETENLFHSTLFRMQVKCSCLVCEYVNTTWQALTAYLSCSLQSTVLELH